MLQSINWSIIFLKKKQGKNGKPWEGEEPGFQTYYKIQILSVQQKKNYKTYKETEKYGQFTEKILINRTCLPKNPDDKLKDIKITVLKILKELK